MLRLRVLGALEATLEPNVTGPPDLGGPRQRSVLALLLVARRQVVSVDRLVEDLWNGEPPRRAIGALQAYVSHLRRALEPHRAPRSPAAILVSEPPGYAIRVDEDAVDAWRFESLVRRANDTPDPAAARVLLDEALGLWRGPAYAEFATESWAVAEAARLDGLRIVARERWCETVLRGGEAHEAVMAAEALTREHPLREEGWRLLAMSLYAGGRQADALDALRRARDILAEELGMDPGPALLQVETDVLRQRLAITRPPVHETRSPADRAAGDAAPSPVPTSTPPIHTPGAPTTAESSDLFGRDVELNALHALAAESAGRAERRVVLIAGEAGAGKSALVDRFARELRSNQWRVVVGRCPESAGAPPAWAWVEALQALAADVDPGRLAPALAPLIDDIPTTPGESDASFGRFLLTRAVVGYLTAAARSRPLAVFLDDLHRGDSETLALLDGVAAGVSGVPLVVIAAYRPAEVPAGLRDALAGLAAVPPIRIALDGLDPAQAARLIRSIAGVQPDQPTLRALVDRTGGNPFYLTESARLLGSEGRLVATSKVPEGVRDVLRRRFARLPEITVAVLRLAAVIGRDVDIDILVLAAEVDEETVLDALEAGVLAGLLTEPTSGSVRFGHVLVRDTLYDDLPLLRRGRWHARIAGALASVRPGDAAALAHHYHQAGTAATARNAVDAGVRAAEQAVARYAHETAAELFAQALADLDRLPDPTPDDSTVERTLFHHSSETAEPTSHLDERVELIARLSRSQIAAGASIAALASRDLAMTLAHRNNRRDLLIRALTAADLPTPWITRPYGSLNSTAIELIDAALTWTDPELIDDSQRCRLLCTLVAETGGELNIKATQAAQEAERIARRVGDPALIGLALHAMSSVVSAELEIAHRLRIGRELLQIGELPGLAVFALLGHHVMLHYHGVRADPVAMAEQIDALDVLVRRYRWRQAEGTVEMHRGLVAHLTDRMADAEASYARAADMLHASGALDADGIALLAFLTLRISQGREGELADAVRSVDSAPDVIADLLALPLIAQGRMDKAREVRRVIRPVRRDFFHCLLLTMRGMIVAKLGERAEAAEVTADLLPYRGQIGGAGTGSFAVGPVDIVLGDLALLLDRPRDAREHYAGAITVALQCGNDSWVQLARRRLDAVGGGPAIS
jgi:DNA-binding SARP family transcriptional activator